MADKIILFAYNFPHKKTQDFIFKIIVEKIPIELIIAADPVKLNIPQSAIRTKIKHQNLIHPKDIAKVFQINYHVLPHNSSDACNLVKETNCNLGVISGARILKEDIIGVFSKGIINFHPGLIPECRGLDALQWSIYNNIPLGVTSHIIDKRIDAGKILIRKKIDIYPDDTLLDLSERIFETQIDIIKPSIEKAIENDYVDLKINKPYNRKMPATMEKEIPGLLPEYILKHTK